MIFVTSFEPAGKGKCRVAFDNGIKCLLYRGEAARFSLKQEGSISEEQMNVILHDIVYKRAAKRTMHLLEQMDRSEKKLREKLAVGEYPQCAIDYAIDYVKKYHYIDDLRLAQNYVRYHKQNLSCRQIYVKLIQKGVEPENIENALDKEYDADEIEHIYNLLEKKKYDKENCDDKEFRRIYQFLLRRGFKSSQILTAMRKGRD